MPKKGKQTWVFSRPAHIESAATVAGRLESEGPFGALYDIQHDDDRLGKATWEQAEQQLLQEAAQTVLAKANLTDTDVDLMVGGDLNAQLSGFYFGTRSLAVPAFGVFSACASICEALTISALAIDGGYAKRTLVGTSSHNSTAERQFRYPTEYGIQKPPTAQRTVTGAGMAVLSQTEGKVQLTEATVGQVTDFGIHSPWEMGAAMAPAAHATIRAHLQDTGRTFSDFDAIFTGDLGRIGLSILEDLFHRDGIATEQRLFDCGAEIYYSSQPEVFSGGSGGACCTLVTFSHLLQQLTSGTWKRVLVSATGALLSAVTAQQHETIPCISHAVVLERKDG